MNHQDSEPASIHPVPDQPFTDVPARELAEVEGGMYVKHSDIIWDPLPLPRRYNG